MAETAGTRPRRIAAIGLDSVEWPLVESMVADGELPTLARMRATGTTCRLRNERLCRSSLVWDAFLTDDPDPDDRFAGGIAFDPATYTTYKVGAAAQRAFVDDIDGSLVALDVPYLATEGRAPNARVCVWGGHIDSHPRGSQPPDLLPRIDAAFGTDPAVGVDQHGWHSRPGINRLARAAVAATTRRAQIATWLMEQVPDWRLLLVVQHAGHAAGECFAHALDPAHPLASIKPAALARIRLYDVYRSLDDALGRVARTLPEDAVLVAFSLHGLRAGGADLASTVLLPELLHRLEVGRAELRDPDQVAWRQAGHPPVVPGRRVTWSGYMQKQSRSRPGRLARVARHVGRRVRTGEGTERTAVGPALPIDRVHAPLTYGAARWYRHAWPQMRAFALPSFADGRVRINVEGRERDGVVPAGDYGRTCDEVERLLRECRNPRTGEALVAEVTRPRAHDPLAAEGPDADLVIEWSGCADALEHADVGTVGPFPFLRTAEHTPHGFIIAAGPGVEHRDLGERPAAELTPMIRDLLHGREPGRRAGGGRPAPVSG